MCEILFMRSLSKKGLTKGKIAELVAQAVIRAHGNPQGFGVFSENKIYRKPRKLTTKEAPKIIEKFEGAKYIVIHLRLATHGAIIKANTHPFLYKHYALVHNGIMSGVTVQENRTDSEALLREIVNAEGKTTPTKIKKALDKKSGSFSVFLSDPKGDLYYFRRTSSFTLCAIPSLELLVGATNKDALTNLWNEKSMGFFDHQRYKKIYAEPQEGAIYRLTDKLIKRVGKIKDEEYNYTKIGANEDYKNYWERWEKNYEADKGEKNEDTPLWQRMKRDFCDE